MNVSIPGEPSVRFLKKHAFHEHDVYRNALNALWGTINHKSFSKQKDYPMFLSNLEGSQGLPETDGAPTPEL
mgnify:CR=1 FL=1